MRSHTILAYSLQHQVELLEKLFLLHLLLFAPLPYMLLLLPTLITLLLLVRKGTLAKLNSGELVEDLLKRVRTAELKRANRRELGNRVIQRGGVITVGKVREKVADKRANAVAVAHRALIKAEKAAHNAIVGPCSSMFKGGSKVKSTFKQDYKAKRVILAGFFKELQKSMKKGKSGSVPLAETVS